MKIMQRVFLMGIFILVIGLASRPEMCFSAQEIQGKVNINTATKEQISALPGIGPKLADRVIEYRTKNKFKTIEEIKKVKGIGEKKFEKFKDFLSLDGETTVKVIN